MQTTQQDNASMTDLPVGYRDIPEEDRKKAQIFFDRAKTVADTGNFEYGIELYLQGLNIDPENTDAHQYIREISLKRKATGGKRSDIGMFEKMKLAKATKDEKLNTLNAEKLLAYDPGNMDRMVNMFQCAIRAGYFDTAMWVGAVLMKANSDSAKPDFSKFITLKDGYKSMSRWKEATDACYWALKLKPDDMDLQKEVKDLSARHTMEIGKYGKAKSFRESIRDMDSQKRLLDEEKDYQSDDFLMRKVKEAEVEWQNNAEDLSLFSKYIDALQATENPEQENKAIEQLEQVYRKTNQFKWRQRVGIIKMTQLSRMERMMRADAQRDPEMRKEYEQFARERAMTELQEYKLVVENYPTDTTARFEVARRLFALGQYQEAIPVFQHVRSDPKYRVRATILLGRAFLSSNYIDEAIDTLKAAVDEYPAHGDERSKEMLYWYGRALEGKSDGASAIKQYSRVAQMDFNYLDVQERIKRLRQ